MNSAFLAVPLTAVLVAVFTPFAIRLAFRVGAVSTPGGRHVHQRQIPRLGGLAIAAAFLVSLAVLAALRQHVADLLASQATLLVGLLGGGVVMCAVGVIDDTRGLRAVHKLGVQIAAAVLAYHCGFRIEGVHLPLIGDVLMGYLSLPVTMLWIVGVVNAVNLIDGLDGLAAGVVLFASSVNLFVAFRGGSPLVALVSGATAGASIGFLFFNFNPARIFMGDSGSYFFGFILALTGLQAHKASTAVSLLVPMVALGVPIVDTLFAMVRRILERRSVFSPDRGHIHHRLLDMGITHRRAVLIIYGFSVVCTVIAIGMWMERSMEIAGAVAAAVIVIGGLVRFGGTVGTSLNASRQEERFRLRDTELLRRAIPALPAAFERTRDDGELFKALASFAETAELSFVEASPMQAPSDADPVFRWASSPESSKRGLVVARYPAGPDTRARLRLTFGWISDFGEVSPQSEILLQIATDVFAAHLLRLRSRYAPEVQVPADEQASLVAAVTTVTTVGATDTAR